VTVDETLEHDVAVCLDSLDVTTHVKCADPPGVVAVHQAI
jgi:hypothetical protein